MYVIVFSRNLVENQAMDLRYQLLGEKDPDGYFCRFVSEDLFHMLTAICESLCLGNPIPESKDPAMTWAGEAFGNQGNELYHHANKERLNAGLDYLLMLAWDIYSKANDQNFKTLHPAVEKAVIALNNPEDGREFLTSGLKEIARHCGLSATRLSRLFHSQIGTPLINYRNQKRIEYFERVYRSSTKMTLAEAAYASGFGSYAQFQKTFIKIFGYSPAIYKQKMSEISLNE